MSITSILVPLMALLWLAVPLAFAIAFFLWWRRLRHWSFALLSAATALSVVAQVCSFLATNIPRFGRTPEQVAATQDIWALAYASIGLHLVMGVLLLIGAFGLVSAARDDFILDDAKRQTTDAA
jgi:hypothetical protein